MSKPWTWDELASWYDTNIGGRKARTLPMNQVFDACVATGRFKVNRDGSIEEVA